MVTWSGSQTGYGFFGYGGLKAAFASSGTVDTNLITRFQYQNQSSTTMRLVANAAFNLDSTAGSADKVAVGTTKGIVSVLFIAKASSFAPGVIPTPSQIRALGDAQLIMARSTSNVFDADAAGSWVGAVFDATASPLFTSLVPGAKYWALLMPCIFTYTNGSGRSTFPSVSVANYTAPPGTTVDGIGRVISFWTNRGPNAPVITSPASGSVVAPGSTFALSFNPADPDETGIGGDPFKDDMAGVQVQYAPRPTPDSPSPTWIDLPIANSGGTLLGPGWAIQQSLALPSDSGSFLLLNNQTISVKCGSNVITANQGALPGGDWQIRVRTFDFGLQTPRSTYNSSFAPPWGWGRDRSTLTPGLAPAFNTSPWSDAITVSVPSQVPPPIPLSPIDGIALIDTLPIVLTWQYRNSASPPFAQASRTVQYRRVGAATWTTLVSGAGSGNTATIAAGVLSATDEYEWRVQTTDADGVVSNYSAVGRFWIVPAPVSGGIRPIPTETIEGAALGCGKHRIVIFRRGGKRRVGEIKNITYLDWGRMRDDISTSKIVVSGWDIDCGNLLAKLQTWAYEVVIFRDNGFSVSRVWEGPITLLTFERDKVTIQAKDVMGYAYRRIIKQRMSDSGTGHGTTVVNRATRVLQNVFAPDDPNILAYLTPLAQSDDAMQYRSTPAYSRTAFEEVDDMAANSGLDYTAVGRSILLWGTKHRIGTLPEFRDEDLGSPPIVSEYGMSMANRYVVSDGNGVWGEATRLDVSGNDPIYGLVEMLSSSWASDSPDDSGTYTQAGLQTLKASFAGFAERSISDRYSPGAPVVVRVPDNTTLNPGTVLSIQQLVPGVVIPLRSTGTLRSVVASQKLDALKVVETDGEEKISITMSPFSRDDNSGEEVEG